jgi:hypothetical protein
VHSRTFRRDEGVSVHFRSTGRQVRGAIAEPARPTVEDLHAPEPHAVVELRARSHRRLGDVVRARDVGAHAFGAGRDPTASSIWDSSTSTHAGSATARNASDSTRIGTFWVRDGRCALQASYRWLRSTPGDRYGLVRRSRATSSRVRRTETTPRSPLWVTLQGPQPHRESPHP